MRVLLAGPDYEENLSIRYLSGALLRAGHETTLSAFNVAAEIGAVANAARNADLVGLSICFQARAHEFLELAREIKARDPRKLIVAGGHYASCAAAPLLANHPEIDLVVLHEGEQTLVEIANGVPLSEISGIAYRSGGRLCFTKPRPAIEDLDSLALPDRRGPVQMVAGVPTSYLMGSRGCYGNCAYCCITTLHRLAPGKRFRQRDVKCVADEMAALYRDRGTRQFVFHDDNFLVPSEARNHERISSLEAALRRHGVKDVALVIKCRPADANYEVLSRLKDLGLVRVFLGIESATTRGLAALERDQSVDDSVRALDTCATLDISAQFTLMTFHPDATLETLRQDVAFLRRYCGSPLNYCRAEIYAGTPLERRMIECGRATGDYRARTYRILDPVAELACKTALEAFHLRCWSNGSLLVHTIGLDHAAAVAKRFHPGSTAGLVRRVREWVRAVNTDTIDLLEEVVELSTCADHGFRRSVRELMERERRSRERHTTEGAQLRLELAGLRPSSGLGRRAAAALIAVAIPSLTAQAPACSITGVITDPAGSAVPNARITIIDQETETTRTVTSDAEGRYTTNLAAGRYTLRVVVPGFRVAERRGIAIQARNCETVNVSLALEVGVCETVAVGLTTQPAANLYERKKPFTYMVGERKGDTTFQGIAKLVYGDAKKWVQIFEANRSVLPKPGPIPYGTPIYIPPEKRQIPKLVAKVAPVFPKSAAPGDVVLDLTLAANGTVTKVEVIDGPPPLVTAAVSAVQQWRYRPLIVKGKAVDRFVIVLPKPR